MITPIAQCSVPRILVIDDFEEIPNLVKQYLSNKAGYHVDIAFSGEEALTLLPRNCIDHQCYDLIIIDFAMPIMDGLTAAKRIRELEKQLGWNNASIIFFTAHEDIARVSSSILADLQVSSNHVYTKLNLWKMFEDIIGCFDQHKTANGS